jgi:soluble lytic murein transglycosylase-like protein
VTRRGAALALCLLALAACGGEPEPAARSTAGLYPNETPALRALIQQYSDAYGVPVDLVQRVVVRESRHIPTARNGPYYGLMQIHPQTARIMGYRGRPQGLLNPETNLRYGVKYLHGAWLVAGGDHDEAVGWYSRGYYYEAKRLGLLEETGLD